MINAKNIFTVEREMMLEVQKLMYGTNLSSEEQENILYSLDGLTESEFNELNKRLIDQQINSLDRLRNGEFLNASQVNAAVIRAAKNE